MAGVKYPGTSSPARTTDADTSFPFESCTKNARMASPPYELRPRHVEVKSGQLVPGILHFDADTVMKYRGTGDLALRRRIPFDELLLVDDLGDLDRCKRTVQARIVERAKRLGREGVCNPGGRIVPNPFACCTLGQLRRDNQASHCNLPYCCVRGRDSRLPRFLWDRPAVFPFGALVYAESIVSQ